VLPGRETAVTLARHLRRLGLVAVEIVQNPGNVGKLGEADATPTFRGLV
jgi:hypothetical protein